MADDKLPAGRPESMAATISDKVMSRSDAISLSPLQNASSRLTLVLSPAMTIARLVTIDFTSPSNKSTRSEQGRHQKCGLCRPFRRRCSPASAPETAELPRKILTGALQRHDPTHPGESHAARSGGSFEFKYARKVAGGASCTCGWWCRAAVVHAARGTA